MSSGTAGSPSSRPRNSDSASRTMPSISSSSRADARLQRRVIQRLDLQPQPRQRRLQVVRHRGQHARAAVEVAVQAVLHGVEGARRIAQLARAALGQLRAGAFRGRRCPRPRQLRQRPGDVARREVQHHHQDQHQQDEVEEQVARQRRAARHARDAVDHRVAVGEAHRDVVALRAVLVRGELVRLVERHRHGIAGGAGSGVARDCRRRRRVRARRAAAP